MSKKTKIGIGVAVVAVIGIVVGILVTRPKGDFTLPATLTVNVPLARTGTAEVTLTPPKDKTLPAGDITFSIKETTLPAGLKVAFNPAKITVKAGDEQKKTQKTTLSVEAGTAAKTGTYTLTVVAKGGGVTRESKLTINVVAAPDYALEVSPTAVTVRQGASATVTVTVKPNDTMRTITKETVDLTVTGAPTGVRVTVDPTKVPVDKPTATVKINVPATGVDARDYTLTITGKASGIADKTASLRLTVQLVDFSLKAEPAEVTVAPGATARVTIAITRTNHTDAVRFTARGLPAGVTATFDPASATGASTTLTLTVPAEATPGTATITVEGTDGVRTKTATFRLTITPPPAG